MNQNVVEAMKAAKADPNTKTILLTGRRGGAAKYVRNILRNNDLFGKRVIGDNNKNSFNAFQSEITSGHDVIHPKENLPDAHEEYYAQDHMYEPNYPMGNKGKPAGDTFAHKSYVITKLVKEGNYSEVALYDDRLDHLQMFEQLLKNFLKEGLIQKATIYRVIENPNDVDATILEIPIHI